MLVAVFVVIKVQTKSFHVEHVVKRLPPNLSNKDGERKIDGAKSRISLEKFLFKIKNKWKMNKKKKKTEYEKNIFY